MVFLKYQVWWYRRNTGTYRNISITGGSSSGATTDVVTDGSSVGLQLQS